MATGVPAAAQRSAAGDSLLGLASRRDYFSLGRALAEPGAGGQLRTCLQGYVDAAFRRYRPAADGLRACDRGPDSIRTDARGRLWPVLGELGEFDAAIDVIDDLIADADSAGAQGLAAARALLDARRGSQLAQASRAGARARIGHNAFGMALVPVTLNGRVDTLILDTGAGMSVLTRSLADSLGVRPLGGHIGVRGATGSRMAGSVALGTLTVAGVALQDVPFVVLPDSALTVRAGPAMLRIRGIVGLPVLMALEEFTLTADGWLVTPDEPHLAGAPNLAVDETRLITSVGYGNHHAVMGVDTGARTTTLYPPAFGILGGDTVSGVRTTTRIGGAGGTRTYQSLRLPSVTLSVGDTVVRAREVVVLRDPPSERARYLMGNLGQDVLDAYTAVTFNFRAMIMRLGPVAVPR
jgi:hypothetical protein